MLAFMIEYIKKHELFLFRNCYPTLQAKYREIRDGMKKITKIAYVSFYTVVFYAEKWGIVQ